MGAFNLYVFNRAGVCLHYAEWRRPKPVAEGAGTMEDDAKMMFGLAFSLKSLCTALDPAGAGRANLGEAVPVGTGCFFKSFCTNNYRMNFLETPTGIKFILNTSPNAGNLQDLLWAIYRDLYCECVMKNPLYTPGTPFRCEQFTQKLEQLIKPLQAQ